MSDHSPDLWQLTLEGNRAAVHEIADQLEAQLEPDHVSVSLFGDEGPWTLNVVYDGRPAAETVQKLQSHAGIASDALVALDDKNWVLESLRDLKPVRAGRFYVHGYHDAPGGAETVSICIPAGMAFGTGHHETTSGCLMVLDELLARGKSFHNVLDLGTGSGLLAIAAAKTTNADIIASDIDAQAVEVAQENAATNHVDNVEFVTADGLDDPVFRDQKYDLIFANILAQPLIDMSLSILAHLAPGGHLVLAGLLTRQAERVSEAYLQDDMQMRTSFELEEWTILHLQKEVSV